MILTKSFFNAILVLLILILSSFISNPITKYQEKRQADSSSRTISYEYRDIYDLNTYSQLDSLLVMDLENAYLISDKGESYQSLSEAYETLNAIDSAIHYCMLGIDHYSAKKNFEKVSRGYSRMHGLIRWNLGGLSEETYIVENYLDSALNNAYKSHDKNLIVETFILKGLYTHNYDFNLAMDYFNRAIDSINDDESLKPLLFRALFQRGNALIGNKQYQPAEHDYLRCIDIIDTNKDFESRRDGVYSQLGIIYQKTGELRKGISYMNKAFMLSKNKKDPDLTGIYSTLAKLYRDIGQKDSSIIVMGHYINYLFYRFNMNNAMGIASSGALFKISEYQKKIKDLNTQNLIKESRNTFQKRFIFLLIIFALFLSGLSFIMYRQFIKTRKAYTTIRDKNDKIEQQANEIEKLREQKREELTDRFEHDLILLDKLMTEDKLFLQPDLNLFYVANILKINHTYLSSIINRHYGFSFTNLLNQYRINEAVRLLNSGIHEKYSIEAISKMVGFKSKSAFYRAFRQHKSCTPTEYLTNDKSD